MVPSLSSICVSLFPITKTEVIFNPQRNHDLSSQPSVFKDSHPLVTGSHLVSMLCYVVYGMLCKWTAHMSCIWQLQFTKTSKTGALLWFWVQKIDFAPMRFKWCMRFKSRPPARLSPKSGRKFYPSSAPALIQDTTLSFLMEHMICLAACTRLFLSLAQGLQNPGILQRV